MSLRTGTPVAQVTRPLINPNNLKIEGFYCQDSFNGQTLVMLYQDIRELVPQGFVVDDHDVLVTPEELVRLREIIDLDYQIIGKQVDIQDGGKLGKVADYATEVNSMYIQKLYVSRTMLKSFASGQLSVDRSQIVEVTPRHILILDVLQGTPATAPAGAA